MREKLLELNRSINASKKTRRLIGFVALFVLAILPSIMLISYSYYINEDASLLVEGTASIGGDDLTLRIFLQNRDSSGNPSLGYTRVYFIPQYEYSYNSAKTKCTSGVSIDSFTDNKFTITSSKKGYCEVYFDALGSSIIKSDANAAIRIFAEQTRGKQNYKEVGKVPNETYSINEAKTSQTCSNVTLYGTTIKVTASGDFTCQVYLDIGTTLTSYIRNNVYIEDGVNGLYYHDGEGNYTNANLEIGDNSYRYAGADASVNNYVCFDGDDCTKEENLFRIISVDSDNKIKIIKVTSTSNRYWNGRAGYIAGARAEDVAQSLWNGSSFLNIWAIKKADGSYYISYTNSWLNGEYLVSLGENGKLVETTTWSVAGLTWAEIQANNAKGIYDIETNNKAIYDAKVGLMYVHEYMYAALPTYWSKVGYNSSSTSYDYRSSVGNNWMWSSGVPWTISRARDGEWDAYRIAAAGNPGVSNVDSSAQPVRPAFVLSSSTRVINADVKDIGTKTNPMIIGE